MSFFGRLFGQTNIIYIHTDKQQYYAGEVVTGRIMLSVVNPLHVDGIYLKLEGHEHVEFDAARTRTIQEANGQQRTEHYTVRVSDTQRFFRRRYCIYQQKCTLAGGNFVFPFTFPLDSRLPGTFEISKGRAFSQYFGGDISYRVEAEVAIPGMLKPNLYHCQDILICEPLRTQMMTTNSYKESKVTFLCCIPKGQVAMSATIDRNAYGPGDVVQLHLTVDNSASTVNLEALSLKLVRTIKGYAGMDSYRDCETVAKTRTPGLKAGDRADRQIQMVLPHDAEPSTDGRLVKCAYELSVVLKVPWSPDVVITQPVQIYAPQRTTYVANLQYPANWNPNVFPTADLQNMQFVTY